MEASYSSNSISHRPPGTLAPRLQAWASGLLLDLANARPGPEAFARFKRRWERYGLPLGGDEGYFRWVQQRLQEVWDGRKAGIEGTQVALCLGLRTDEPVLDLDTGRFLDSSGEPPPIRVDWSGGRLYLEPRDLMEVAWLTLLCNSRRLAICGNQMNGCLTPYFLRTKPKQRFCSDACALPTQREHKLKWWREHGRAWRRRRRSNLRKRKRGGAA